MANLYVKIAQANFKSNEYQKALGAYRDALNRCQKHYEENTNRVEIAEIYVQMGDTYMKLEEYQQASEFYLHALQIHQNLATTSTLTKATITQEQDELLTSSSQTPISTREAVDIYYKLGKAYFGNRELELAIKSYTDALIARKILKLPENRSSVNLNYSLGFIYLSLGDAQKALKYFERTIELVDVVLVGTRRDNIEKADCYLRIGDSYKMVTLFIFLLENKN